MNTQLPYGGEVATVGDLTVIPVFDGFQREDPTHFFINRLDQPREKGHDADDWAPYRDLLDADGLLEHTYGAFLVDTDGRRVLVDAGVGPGQIGPYGPFNRVIRGGELPKRLRELDIDTASFTDVLLTHLHPDHYGWATADDAALFPNATFRCHTLDWNHFVGDDIGALTGFAATLPSLIDRLELFDHDGPLFPGIDVQLAPGHTPGSVIVILSSGASRAMLLGDVVHCPVELLDNDWASLGDFDRSLARRTKESLARELEGTGTPVVGAHFPGLRFGRLVDGSERKQWVV
jgi:glyoxylase-like metal-dependent hydrolase (beta-lactamase superfamily II)